MRKAAGEMAQLLRRLAVLSEGLHSVPTTNRELSVSPGPGDLTPSNRHICRQNTNAYETKINTFKERENKTNKQTRHALYGTNLFLFP